MRSRDVRQPSYRSERSPSRRAAPLTAHANRRIWESDQKRSGCSHAAAWRSIQPNPLGLSRRTLRSTLASAIHEKRLDVGCVRPRVVEKRRECFGRRPASLVDDRRSTVGTRDLDAGAAPCVVAIRRVVERLGAISDDRGAVNRSFRDVKFAGRSPGPFNRSTVTK